MPLSQLLITVSMIRVIVSFTMFGSNEPPLSLGTSICNEPPSVSWVFPVLLMTVAIPMPTRTEAEEVGARAGAP